ncbi:MAG: NADPH:quinone oxidoreductase family protein [Acidobacteriota bacterium]
MKAWLVKQWGEPQQMTLEEIAIPTPAAGEVRIKNQASAVNFFDILQIQGKYQIKPPFPFSPGAEVAGVVDAVGEGVTGFTIGDRVQAGVSTGGYAEYAIAKANRIFKIPDAMSFTEAAAMYIVYQTAYFALKERAKLQAGEWLLVHSGAGGVGMSAIQIGKAFGAKVIATAGSDEKLAFCKSLGADFTLSYRDDSWVDEIKKITTGHGVDVIYDPVGGDVFDLSSKCIATYGRLLVIGFAGGRIPTIAANRILLKNISIVGVFWGAHIEKHPDYLAQSQNELFAMYTAGKIKPIVSKAYALEDAPQALQTLANRQAYGKLVLTM